MNQPPPEVLKILSLVEAALLALEQEKITGTVTIHCAVDGYQLEVNSRHKKVPKGPARKGWEK